MYVPDDSNNSKLCFANNDFGNQMPQKLGFWRSAHLMLQLDTVKAEIQSNQWLKLICEYHLSVAEIPYSISYTIIPSGSIQVDVSMDLKKKKLPEIPRFGMRMQVPKTFDHVDFYYHENRKIFSNFDLTVNAGEKVALVGPSGAGKTTVVKLLMRLYNIKGGEIMIDGQNVASVTQDSLWKNVSMVPQDPILFHRSLMENIRYGKPEATDEEVVAAAKLAHCHEFIVEFPEKYNIVS